MKIEAGKFYRRADGRKVGPAGLINSGGEYPWLVGGEQYTNDGRFSARGPSEFDLACEWDESPFLGKGLGGSVVDKNAEQVNALRMKTPGEQLVEKLASAKLGDVVQIPDGLSYEDAKSILHEKEPVGDIKAEIADEAKRIVSGARRSAYGTPEQNFERIARFWQAYFENTGRGDVKITAADVSPLMRLMKEARLCETPDHKDSFVDIVGYTLTGAEVNRVKPS